jgi:hypothetical protein
MLFEIRIAVEPSYKFQEQIGLDRFAWYKRGMKKPRILANQMSASP